ncbi:MAG: hypothetical protein Q4C48_08040 [Lachnospiraceae bacterium]|nr:hypothetical protein [Lachnospiraceae bacterium]
MYWPKNYKHNCRVELPEGYLNGQGVGALAPMRYGLSTVAHSGCGTLAVYNALVALGRPAPLPKIIRELELYAESFFGLLGTVPFFLAVYFRRHKVPLHMTFSYRRTFRSRYAVAAYWTKRPFFSGAHVVFLERLPSGRLRVYNRYSNRGCAYELASPEELTTRARFIVGYEYRPERK